MQIPYYHLSIKIISRGKGKSAVAAASYRSGDALTNENEGTLFDYSRKGGIVHTEILLPTNAPREFANRSTLWNAVEKTEKASNAQLAREVEFSLPRELTMEQNIELARRYAQEQFVNKGMCADLCFHDKGDGNPHVHIMLTMRPLNDDGTWGAKQKKEYILDGDGNKIYDPKKRQYQCRSIKATDWNDRGKAEEWRAAWADAVNAEFASSGIDKKVDHRSYARQGIDQIPTVHMGVSATQMERRGIATDRGNVNREIGTTNSQIRQLRARVNKVKTWLDGNKAYTPPTLHEVLKAILDQGAERSHYQKIADLQLAAKTLVFIQENHIGDLLSLADKVNSIQRDCTGVYDRKKKAERRIKTLDKHIEQSEIYKKHRKIQAQYDKLYSEYKALSKQTGLFSKSKADKALAAAQEFYSDHRPELAMFATADKYLRDVLQKRFDPAKLPPVTAWRKERDNCASELGTIDSKYQVLKSEVEGAEAIKRFAVKLMLPDEPQEQRQKGAKNWEASL